MSIYSIYKATNIYNGKSYIGFAARCPARKTEHLNESYREKSACYHTHFHRAIRKYGFDAFVWEIIFQSENGEYTLQQMEPHFIQLHNTFLNGYNQTKGGEGSLGRKHSEETKSKIREKRKLQVISEETRRKMSLSKKGRPKPQSMRDKLKGNKNAQRLR